jgi:hypothetical protein
LHPQTDLLHLPASVGGTVVSDDQLKFNVRARSASQPKATFSFAGKAIEKTLQQQARPRFDRPWRGADHGEDDRS